MLKDSDDRIHLGLLGVRIFFSTFSFRKDLVFFSVIEVYGLCRRGLKRVGACVSTFSPDKGNRTLWRSQYHKWARSRNSAVGSLSLQLLFKIFFDIASILIEQDRNNLYP